MADPGTYPEMTEFMKSAMRRAGATTVPDLCRKTGLDTADDRRLFYKWLNGENRPWLTNVLPLMLATGMVAGEGEEAAVEPARSVHAPGSTEALLEALTAEVKQGFANVAQRFEELEKLLPSAVPPAQPKRRKAN